MIRFALSLVFVIAAAAANGAEFRYTWSGWGVENPAADVNDDMTGIEGNLSGRGTFGRADNHTMVDIVFNGAPCEFDEAGSPIAVSLDFVGFSGIIRTPNGDQIFRTLDTSMPNQVCFNFATGVSEVVAHLSVIGGTGRFEGATGSVRFDYTVVPVGSQNSLMGSESGQIWLAPGN